MINCAYRGIYFSCRNCFVSTDEAQTIRSFVRAASHPRIQFARVNETLWGLYILRKNKEYTQSEDYCIKTLVLCIGKQPNSSTWVLNSNLQLEGNGQLIPEKEQNYFW